MNIRSTNSPLSIGMLLLPGFNNLAANAFIDPFRAANYLHGNTLYQWDWLGLDDNPVTASNSLSVSVLNDYLQCTKYYDYVVVNASWTPEKYNKSELNEWLSDQSVRGSTLIGVDTGAFVLGFAGLLHGYRVAVHYEHTAAFVEMFPASQVSDALYTVDRTRLSCCGGHAATDLALEIMRSNHGIDLANGAARYIFHERLRSQGETQLSTTIEPVGYSIPNQLRDAIALMERNLEEPLHILDIVQLTGVSQRKLERIFKTYTGLSPVRYYIDVRLDRARGLVTQTQLSIVEIAAACGFNSSENFSRAYKKRFELAPTKDRKEGRVPFHFRSFPSHAGLLSEF